jgi:hypothetical protein
LKLHEQVREDIIEAESLTGVIHDSVWIDFRDGLDDLATALSHSLEENSEQAEYKLRESEVHFRTCLQDAWLKAASIQIDRLENALHSWRVRGNTDLAYEKLESAIKLCGDSRSTFPKDAMKARELARDATIEATLGFRSIGLTTSLTSTYLFQIFSFFVLALIPLAIYLFYSFYQVTNIATIMVVVIMIIAVIFFITRRG